MSNQEQKSFLVKAMDLFSRVEIRVRSHLSHYPVVYTIIGGTAMILFWRGVWHTADILQEQGGLLGFIFYEPVNLILTAIVLLVTGLFVSYFIGDTILMSGLRGEKRTADETLKDVQEEEIKIKELRSTIKEIKKEVDDIKEVVDEEHKIHHRNDVNTTKK